MPTFAVTIVLIVSGLSLLADILLAADVNITYVSGTCKKTVPTFNMSTYYNQDSILVTDMNGVDVSSSSWDLGKDSAFTGYNVMYCGLTPTSYGGYLPTAVLQLIQQKGFNVTQSCNMAGLLAYPAFHVFILIDRTESVVISDADANTVAAFYT
ncbi:membrane-associated protein, putative [Bodo saltans]|uniref:Membrane-associated protein, putative n=1 Tax=Bodo saltans TaxID=75058 RepID=A0A0S4KK68_BODSA|nr:membrane-associated protein, putative [Bodo saltans]|eukprot:CUI11641.1 membrane-associated protein, putative [Bodo saltans]